MKLWILSGPLGPKRVVLTGWKPELHNVKKEGHGKILKATEIFVLNKGLVWCLNYTSLKSFLKMSETRLKKSHLIVLIVFYTIRWLLEGLSRFFFKLCKFRVPLIRSFPISTLFTFVKFGSPGNRGVRSVGVGKWNVVCALCFLVCSLLETCASALSLWS